jgi:hypothetical protein
MASGSETRASRDADDERILVKRERGVSKHMRRIRQWRAGAHVSIRLSSIRADKIACPRLHLVNPHNIT